MEYSTIFSKFCYNSSSRISLMYNNRYLFLAHIYFSLRFHVGCNSPPCIFLILAKGAATNCDDRPFSWRVLGGQLKDHRRIFKPSTQNWNIPLTFRWPRQLTWPRLSSGKISFPRYLPFIQQCVSHMAARMEGRTGYGDEIYHTIPPPSSNQRHGLITFHNCLFPDQADMKR